MPKIVDDARPVPAVGATEGPAVPFGAPARTYPERRTRPRRVVWAVLGPAARIFDAVERAWERPSVQHGLGIVLVAAFLCALVTVELGRRGWLTAGIAALVPRTHFWAVDVAFTLLLVLELVSLVLALARSVTASVSKQFELLALILLRKAFLEVAHVGEPVAWAGAAAHVPVALADMTGALAVFVLAEVHARAQPPAPSSAATIRTPSSRRKSWSRWGCSSPSARGSPTRSGPGSGAAGRPSSKSPLRC